MVRDAFLNRIGTAVPPHDVHAKFVAYAPRLLSAARDRALFQRMARKSQIGRRFSYLEPDPAPERLDRAGFYHHGAFPDTAERMGLYRRHAFGLAERAIADLGGAPALAGVTHLVVTSCTGFAAPGLDLEIVWRFGLNPAVERTLVGFMGCYAAINAFKLARHIVRSEPAARVLVVNLELCTLHLQEEDDLETVLSFLIFADGAAASLVTAEPVGIELRGFHCAVVPDSAEQITWHIGRAGFDMVLSGEVPQTIHDALPATIGAILGGDPVEAIRHWAIHPGGRTVLDAVERALGLEPAALAASRRVLAEYGNMSSPTVVFVLKALAEAAAAGGGDPRDNSGCAMAFGPGLTVESMRFGLAPLGQSAAG